MTGVRQGKVRTVVMTDELFDALAALGRRNGRNASAEIRLACAHWLAFSGNVKVSADAVNTSYQASRPTRRRKT